MPKLHPGQLPKVNEAAMRSTFVKLDPIDTMNGFGSGLHNDHIPNSSKHAALNQQLSTSIQFQKGMLSQIDSRAMGSGAQHSP